MKYEKMHNFQYWKNRRMETGTGMVMGMRTGIKCHGKLREGMGDAIAHQGSKRME